MRLAEEFLAEENFTAYLACSHHMTHRGERLNFKDNPSLVQVYQDPAGQRCIMKSTQAGATEYLICYTMSCSMQGLSVFYVLPTYQLVSRVVRNRVDRTIERTPIYQKAMSSPDMARPNMSMALKNVGLGAIAFVGSNSTAGFTEFPADVLIVDEVDECHPDNLKMAWERLSASKVRHQMLVGNPTVGNFGIAEDYKTSCQFKWHVKCECGKYVHPDFFRNVVRQEGPGTFRVLDGEWEMGGSNDARVICHHCGKPLNRKGAGRWEAMNPGAEKHGYHMNKLFAGTVTVAELLERLEKGTKSEAAMIRFYNGDLGLPYTAKGAKIDREMIDACVGDYVQQRAPSGINVAGVDVGNTFHVVIGNLDVARGKLRVVHVGEVSHLRELLALLRENRVVTAVVDALPERRIVRMLCQAHRGVFAAYYAEGRHDAVSGQDVSIDRTSSLDQVKESLMGKFLEFPKDLSEDFYHEMTVSTRYFDEKANAGKGAWKWIEGNEPDHYFHAMGYMLVARNLVAASPRMKGWTEKVGRSTIESAEGA